jgi:hypothetical protein
VTLDAPAPTNAYYNIDFGDGSPFQNGIAINSFPTFLITHSYQTSGIFKVNITCFNKVSFINELFTVSCFHIFLN